MKSPQLSIIIPVYNAGDSITRLVSAIVDQAFENFELILIDDGSTDNTINVLRGLKKGDERVVILSKKNGGPSSARNAGLDKSRGTYVMFLDADDDIDPAIFTKMVGTMESTNSDLVVCGWQIDLQTETGLQKNYKQVHPEPATIAGDRLSITKSVIRSIGDSGQLYNLWNKLFRADTIQAQHLRFREDLPFGEDLVFTFHYLQHASRLDFIPDPLYQYVSGGGSSLFSKTALIPEFRKINDDELLAYAGKTGDEELDDLVGWVRWRWFLSYLRLVAGTPLPKKEKIELIAERTSTRYPVAKTKAHIGAKKYFVEKIAHFMTRSAGRALLLGSLIHGTRQLIIRFKLLIKR